jgi:nicotinamidase-related amidase
MDRLLQNRVATLGEMEPRRTALLGVHWQEDVVGARGDLGDVFAAYVTSSNIIPRTAKLFAEARKAGVLIVFVNVAFWPGHKGVIRNNGLFNTVTQRKSSFIRGSKGVAVLPEFGPTETDIIIEHSRISAFHGSDLLSVLIGHGIETVAVTGVATNVAVDHTTRDAAQFGYRTVLIEDCCCSSDPSYHDAALKTLRILATNVVKADEFIAELTGETVT